MDTRKSKHFARKLFQMSLDERGCVSAERVTAVLAALDKSPPKGVLGILRFYKIFVGEQLARNTALVEYAGPVGKDVLDEIAGAMERFYGRPMEANAVERPELLAGLRIKVGDDLFENNIESRLGALGGS